MYFYYCDTESEIENYKMFIGSQFMSSKWKCFNMNANKSGKLCHATIQWIQTRLEWIFLKTIPLFVE